MKKRRKNGFRPDLDAARKNLKWVKTRQDQPFFLKKSDKKIQYPAIKKSENIFTRIFKKL